jgi:RNA 2',3'-cyclic 3'-phosphodiesterase
MSENLRLFVAAFPPPPVVITLHQIARELSTEVPSSAVPWTPGEQVHLTFHFLGDVARDRLGDYGQALKRACQRTSACRVRVAGIGCFPNLRQPRVIWAGLRDGTEPVALLQKQMESEFEPLGYIPEKRPFHPHLTIGRAKELDRLARQQLARALQARRETDFGEWELYGIDLVQSVLESTGARYSVLQSFSLRQLPPA